MSRSKLQTVGQLARRSGVTVRTLHHYDAIGLLRPAGRAANGRRLYDRDNALAAAADHALPHAGASARGNRADSRRPGLRPARGAHCPTRGVGGADHPKPGAGARHR